jgi:hypothetical protein
MAGLIGGAAGFIVFSMWDLPEIAMLEEYRPSITSRVYTDSNRMLTEFYLENRTPVDLTDVPELLTKALMAAEDTRFYQHHGLDVRGIARALYRNLRAHRILEGGSTLTQQLAKVLFLSPDRTFSRKFKEMALALRIEQRYTKQEILSLYLNQIYFGNGAYGVEAAARIYFGKPARDLNLAECAMLAGLPRSPKRYSPFKAPAAALARRAYVLSRINRYFEHFARWLLALPQVPLLRWRGRFLVVEYIRQKIGSVRFQIYSGPQYLYQYYDFRNLRNRRSRPAFRRWSPAAQDGPGSRSPRCRVRSSPSSPQRAISLLARRQGLCEPVQPGGRRFGSRARHLNR